MTYATTFCDPISDGHGVSCRRCGSWRRGVKTPECPPYITRSEPDGARLPHIKTADENKLAWITWMALEEEQHPIPAWPFRNGEQAPEEK